MTKQGNLPLKIEPIRLAETGQAFSGRLPIKHLHRLKSLVVSQTGDVEIKLQFGVDEIGIRYLQGHMATSLQLECQRCMEPMELQLDKDMLIAFVKSSVEAEELPDNYDPQVVEQTPIALVDLIEDELILSLPQVPMHKREDCVASKLLDTEAALEANNEPEVVKNPFEILATLKDSE